MNKNITTSIRETLKGHQVSFTIGNQTFQLQEVQADPPQTSKQVAQWYARQLKFAFETFEEKIREDE